MVLNSILLLKLNRPTLTEAVAWPGLSGLLLLFRMFCRAMPALARPMLSCGVRLSGVCHVPVLCRSE